MEIPRFETQNINPRLFTEDIGNTFQYLVHELLLPEHPKLHRFLGGGKDGGIDLIETADTCFVVECKVIGEDDYTQIEQRWKKVKSHLEEHLSDPDGPTKGQSQYQPWYSTDNPISEYVFCISAEYKNEQQRRDLVEQITDFFHTLVAKYTHLSHLSAIVVTTLDWNDLCINLSKQPHSIFRWFPISRPNGLVPLDETYDVGTFRAYLNSSKLPYYSLTEHLGIAPAPEGVTIQNETSLLAHFENKAITGLVINGKGGIGKSRITLELGWLALKMGWTVIRVQGRLKDDALDNLTEKLTPETPALLLIDYIETQNDFNELVETLSLLNDSGIARIHYIAACRSSYYHQAIAASGRHLSVDLSPSPGADSQEWYTKYRYETVKRILIKSGIELKEQHFKICHDLPILAVFLDYLHKVGRNEDLSELLSEIEFGHWVRKRIQLTFEKDVSRELALLIPLFPMTDTASGKLAQDLYRPVFDRLAADGWIERISSYLPSSSDMWVTAHDVLADQILLAYLQSIANTADMYIRDIFSLATRLGCLGSVIVSLQRIADLPPLNTLPWLKIISDAITENENEWKNIRDLLIRTTLLTVPDKIALLDSHKELWNNAEHDIDFQNALGWFAHYLLDNESKDIPESHKQNFLEWIIKAAQHAERSNYIINWGLRFAPDALKEIALRWIIRKSYLFQTHYVIVAWLEIGGDKVPVYNAIKEWLSRFTTDLKASHVYKAWLDAGGDKLLVEKPI
ncbi:MAG: hypothetical protein ACE14V_13600, partial [bacterium]